MKFPRHKGELSLRHNEHKSVYKTAADWIAEEEQRDPDNCFFEWVSDEQRTKAIETNEIWLLQWYPETPVGFICLAAADLDILLQRAADDSGA